MKNLGFHSAEIFLQRIREYILGGKTISATYKRGGGHINGNLKRPTVDGGGDTLIAAETMYIHTTCILHLIWNNVKLVTHSHRFADRYVVLQSGA